MAQDIITATGPAAGHPDLATKALSLLTSTTDRVLAELGGDADAAIHAAILKTDRELMAVPDAGPHRAAWESALHERLRRLAVKVSPTATENQTKPWQQSMAEAFSDLPAMIALTAAKRAIHTPFRYIGEVEAEVRRIAVELTQRRHDRLRSLRRMQADIERAMRPVPALPKHDPEPAKPEEVARINGFLRSIGVRTQFADDGSTYQAAPVEEETVDDGADDGIALIDATADEDVEAA